MTTPFRIFTKGEVLPSRQAFSTDIPRASPPVTTASLSIAFQAIPLHVYDNRDNRNNFSVAEVISVVCVVCHFVTSPVAPVPSVVSVVCVVV